MRPAAVLINTARGPIVDERALAEALAAGRIAAAGLDVYENEPVVKPGLLGLDNVVRTPHPGSATVETRTAMAELAAQRDRRRPRRAAADPGAHRSLAPTRIPNPGLMS